MSRLSTEQVLKDNNTLDPNAVSSLKLTYKALSDVSCLSDFKNLERLDLSFNNLTSLEGLKSCANLKWLAVVQNKLESLKGIEGLSKLTVLNAGKNKLRSMDEVRSLVGLRALILNDNEIVSIFRLDQMKDLNTLVLSRNPVSEIGESLLKVKSITKLSLSNCQLQTIASSLKSCIELKELRLAHNGITTLPAELARNMKLQNLDLGNNAIMRWSDLKVLNSLVNLKNLNLQGNPVAMKEKLEKKIKNVLPNLQIFNAKPADKYTKENSDGVDKVDDSSITATNKLELQKEVKRDYVREKNSEHVMGIASDLDMEKKLKRKRQKTNDNVSEKEVLVHKEEKRDDIRKKNSIHHVMDQSEDRPLDNAKDVDVGKESRQKRQKKDDKLSEKEGPVHDAKVEKKLKKKSKAEQGELDVIDNPEVSFVELFAADTAENAKYGNKDKIVDKAVQDMNSVGGLVTFDVKKKKDKSRGMGSTIQLSSVVEVGMGGPSTWGDE